MLDISLSSEKYGFFSLLLIDRNHIEVQGQEHTHEKNHLLLLLICQDLTEMQGKENTQMKGYISSTINK